MRLKIVFLVFGMFLLSCKQSKNQTDITNETTKKPKTDKKKEVKVEYGRLDYDTIKQIHMLKLYMEKYKLELSKYCLNDSLIKRLPDPKNSVMTGITHNYISKIKLDKEDENVFDIEVSKETFKDSLDVGFYKISTIKDVVYKGFRSNRIFFKAILSVPDTDWVYETDFAIFYQTRKKGQLDYWNVKSFE